MGSALENQLHSNSAAVHSAYRTKSSGDRFKLKSYAYRVVAKEVSCVSKYFDRLVHVVNQKQSEIIPFIEFQSKVELNLEELNTLIPSKGASVFLLDGDINHSTDIQKLLEELGKIVDRKDRILAVLYNPYLKVVFKLMNFLRLRRGSIPKTFVSRSSLEVFAKLANLEVCRVQPLLYFPFRLLFLGPILNSLFRALPGFKWFGLAAVATLRPLRFEKNKPSLTIVVPARNEAGNIDQVLLRLTNLESIPVQLIFIEGHSKDETWEKIQKTLSIYEGPFKIEAYKQTGVGKKNAVKEGFARATGELLTILDADLTMPPELLVRFYNAYCEGKGDFINGSRLVYSMENGAMRFLNHLGNIFFAKALSFVTDTKLTDSLCGTKLLSRVHYAGVSRWCEDFGELDPFGDFELIFPAATLGLGVIDVPIQYQARTYGTTNISRFQHGWQLLRMTCLGFLTVKMGRMPYSKL